VLWLLSMGIFDEDAGLIKTGVFRTSQPYFVIVVHDCLSA
jgi:hypothetical protein